MRGCGLRTLAAIGLAAAVMSGCVGAPPEIRQVGDLPGWTEDDVAAAVPALRRSCAIVTRLPPDTEIRYGGRSGSAGDWQAICAAAADLTPDDDEAARRFLDRWFVAVPVAGDDGEPGLFTGYYTPVVRGSLTQSDPYSVPLYRRPAPAGAGEFPVREEVAGGALAGAGLELVWLDDAVDAFFLEIQGSGIVTLPDGRSLAVGNDGTSGHDYFPIGRALVERGEMAAGSVSMQAIRDWLHAHPGEAQAVMNLNPRVAFFVPREGTEAIGAQGAALTPGRSLAVDRNHISLGVPLWVNLGGPPFGEDRLRRLVVAQDVGGAITGPVRGDLFWGYGEAAGRSAGAMRARGGYTALVPRASIPEGDALRPAP